MSSPVPGPTLADRADIHKSCISIETLLNVLNEYCEAAGAVVALQKKLAKTLRETAGQKVVGEISANAMNASASIFEALSEVDSKFSKIADKEYDSVSAEVKKWFKRLAKEEKIHDERIASANAKIKQAGLTYEKKSKKKSMDASDEHAKYISLISTLGPEVSQEKYNHALNVMQKHVTTTFSVAACLSRLADFEWQKSCECVRRFAPTIGPLGQWRMLCEGGWANPVPPDLPDLKAPNEYPTIPKENLPKPIEEEARQPPVRLTPEPRESAKSTRQSPLVSAGTLSASESSNEPLRTHPPSPTLARLKPPATDPNISSDLGDRTASPQRLEPPKAVSEDMNTGSVRSLSAFPAPPNHFPLPPPRSQQSSYFQSTASGSSNLDFPSHSRLAESPVSAPMDSPGINIFDEQPSRPRSYDLLSSQNGSGNRSDVEAEYREQPRLDEDKVIRDRSVAEPEIRRPTPVRAQVALPPESSYRNDPPSGLRDGQHRSTSSKDYRYANTSPYNADDRLEEFGIIDRNAETSRTDNTKNSRGLERTMTGESNGSIVAAMRNKYSNNPGSMSPPPKEVPRLPLSVNDLATRYQPTDAIPSPKLRANSPPVLRQQSLPSFDISPRQVKETYLDRVSTQTAPYPEHDRRREEKYDKPNDFDRRAKEQTLRERERELELRARELERERARLQTLIEDDDSQSRYSEGAAAQSQTSQLGLRPRERRISLRHQLQRPLSQMELDEVTELGTKTHSSTANHSHNLRIQPKQSNDATHLLPPLSTGNNNPPIPTTQPLYSPKIGKSREIYPDKRNSSSTNVSTSATSDHAPYCGCESCSVSKYKSSGITSTQPLADPKSQQGQRPDKPSKPGGSWIRRLSMPVGNAFSLESKRSQNNSNSSSIYSLGSGIGNTPANASRTRLFSMDGKKNASTTALLSSSMTTPGSQGLVVHEDGRLRNERRSLETSRTNYSRSTANLGPPGRDGGYKIP